MIIELLASASSVILLDSRRSRTGLSRSAVATTLGMFALMVIPLAMLRANSAESSDVVADSLGLPSGFVLVDDFQEYGPRNVLEFFGADSWVPHGMSGTHWIQGEDDNYFLATGHHLPRGISCKLPDGLTIAEGERATWFFRLRLQSDSIDQASLGLATDPRLVRNAGDWDRAGVMARLDRSDAGDGYELKVWDARENRMERIAEIESDVWYNLWFVLDRGEANVFAVYLTESWENASRRSRLFFGDSQESEVNRFSFRDGLTADSILNYVMFMAMDSTGNSLHIADIWMDPSGANLQLPVSKPTVKYAADDKGPVLIKEPDTGALGIDPMYELSEGEYGRERIPHNLIAHVSPILDYDLPEKQFSFKLILQNRSKESVYIADPLRSLSMLVITGKPSVIELPVRPPPALINSRNPINEPAAPIVFKWAVVTDGQKSSRVHGPYEIKPDATLEIVFECKNVVGDRILRTKEEKVYVSFSVPIIDLQNSENSRVLRSDRIEIDIPKPKVRDDEE